MSERQPARTRGTSRKQRATDRRGCASSRAANTRRNVELFGRSTEEPAQFRIQRIARIRRRQASAEKERRNQKAMSDRLRSLPKRLKLTRNIYYFAHATIA